MDAVGAIFPTSLVSVSCKLSPRLYALFCSPSVRVQPPPEPASEQHPGQHPSSKRTLFTGKRSEECTWRHLPSERAKPENLSNCRHNNKPLVFSSTGRRARPRPLPSRHHSPVMNNPPHLSIPPRTPTHRSYAGMAHQRDSRVSFQPRDQFGRPHDPSPQEAVDSNQKLTEEQRGEISQAVSV